MFKKSIGLSKDRVFTTEQMENRRHVEKKYQNIEEMIADGWTTEQLEILIQVPHTQDPNNPAALPKIDGFNCPTSLRTEAESKAYREFRKGKETVKTEDGETKSKKEDFKDKITAIMELESVKNDPVALQMLKELLPVSSVALKLFGYEPKDGEKVSRDWILYRDGKGNRFEDKNGTIAQFAKKAVGVQPALLPAQLDKILEQNPEYKDFITE